MGTDLPEAINDKNFRGLWFDSVTKEGISLRDAGGPLIEQFKRDVLSTAKTRVSSQLTRLRALSGDLDTPQKLASSLGPQRSDASTLASVPPKRDPLSATTVIDKASYLDFLLNWDSILREVPVAMRAAPSGLLPTPGPQPPTVNLGPLLGNATTGSGKSLVTFDPAGDDTRLVTDPSIEYLNTGAVRAAREAWFTCLTNAPMYRRRAEMMMADDPNLAVLAETQSLKQVSKISRASEKDATGALKTVAKNNVEALERFQRTMSAPPPDLWKALGPRTSSCSGDRGSASRDWSGITAKGFVDDLFAHGKETAADRDAARAKLVAELAISAAAFAAALASGGALATVFLASLDAFMVAESQRQANQAGKLADAVSTAADAKMATPKAAARAREEADKKDAQVVVGVILSVLPFLPKLKRGVAAGAEAINEFLRASGTAARGAAAAEAAGPPVVATLRPRARRKEPSSPR